MIEAEFKNFIFMKVGQHAGESFEEILERKRREYEDTGMIWWGYGGTTLHPTKRVMPFARYTIEHREQLTLIMQPVPSNHPPTEVYATEYSTDGIRWRPIPKGIAVRGSRYALVLDEIIPGDLIINLNDYLVPNGPSKGRIASEYISGRVDKACLTRAESSPIGVEPKTANGKYFARIKDPFAVLLRNEK